MKKAILQGLALPCLAIAILTLPLSSCKKEPVKGCMSSLADNYDSDAEESDGSCKYSAEVSFYLTKQKSEAIKSVGVSYIEVYINDSYAGSLNMSQALSSSPSCSQTNNVLKKTINSTSQDISYRLKVVDDDDFVWIDNQEFTDANLKSTGLCNIIYW